MNEPTAEVLVLRKALDRVTQGVRDATSRVQKLIGVAITYWNDIPRRKQSEVVALLSRALSEATYPTQTASPAEDAL